jgi:hypothetical protein
VTQKQYNKAKETCGEAIRYMKAVQKLWQMRLIIVDAIRVDVMSLPSQRRCCAGLDYDAEFDIYVLFIFNAMQENSQ